MKMLDITVFFEILVVLVDWYVCTGISLPLYCFFQYKKKSIDRISLY